MSRTPSPVIGFERQETHTPTFASEVTSPRRSPTPEEDRMVREAQKKLEEAQKNATAIKAERAKAAEGARLKAEADAKAAEEARLKAAEEARLKAEADAKAAEEARLKAVADAKAVETARTASLFKKPKKESSNGGCPMPKCTIM